MLLSELRSKRVATILRTSQLARTTIRTQRGDLARIVREWARISKRINKALARYARAVEDLGIWSPEPIQPRDLVTCLKGCAADNQSDVLDAIDTTLLESESELKKAAKKEARRGERRRVKRENKATKAAKRRTGKRAT